MGVSEKQQNFHFGVEYPFKGLNHFSHYNEKCKHHDETEHCFVFLQNAFQKI